MPNFHVLYAKNRNFKKLSSQIQSIRSFLEIHALDTEDKTSQVKQHLLRQARRQFNLDGALMYLTCDLQKIFIFP